MKVEINKKGMIVSGNAPGSERTREEGDGFLELLNECLGNFPDGGKVIVVRDLCARVKDASRDRYVTGAYQVRGVIARGVNIY